MRFNSSATDFFSASASNYEDGRHYSLRVKDVMLDITEIDENNGIKFFNNAFKETFFNSRTINGKTFANVQRITADTSIVKGMNIREFFLAKNEGLVAYEDYPSRTVWVRR